MAGELRAVLTSIQNSADVDRMGALGSHVAKITRRRHPITPNPKRWNRYFAEMGRVAVVLGLRTEER